jgi:hypothetical protein
MTRDWHRVLRVLALAFAVLEVVSAFFIEAPVVAIVFAALFVVGALVLRRSTMWGAIVLGVLFLIELLGLPFYPREDADDWIIQAFALVLSLAGLVAVVAVLRGRASSTAS